MAVLLTTEKLEDRISADNAPKWVCATCPYCGLRYRHVENRLYRPKTCSEYQCVRRSLHPNIVLR
jgi:hypothetical protein